ncbi:hypothetical protein KFU94_12290 [Chloroflexi bacterium TSY]|nr:hypothetical protein [Chloroflexi bacterium TSY]
MQKIWTGLALALIFVSLMIVSLYRQQNASAQDVAQTAVITALQGGMNQQIPIDVTLLMSTETGVQTVTVPLQLNLNLTIGPVDAIDMKVDLQPASQFVSPITTVEQIFAPDTVTSTDTVTTTSE